MVLLPPLSNIPRVFQTINGSKWQFAFSVRFDPPSTILNRTPVVGAVPVVKVTAPPSCVHCPPAAVKQVGAAKEPSVPIAANAVKVITEDEFPVTSGVVTPLVNICACEVAPVVDPVGLSPIPLGVPHPEPSALA